MKRTFRQAIVVGATSGIGEAIARRLAKPGVKLALLGRRKSELERVALAVTASGAEPIEVVHDVTDFAAIPALFDRLLGQMGGVDLLVYAAGVMPPVAESEYDFAKDRQMMEVNALGAIAWCDSAAPHFEAQRSGTILGISSIAGERGRRGNPAYTTSKAALTAHLEALRNRLSRYGVSVVTVKPGFVDTAMTKGLPGLLWLISADEAARQSLALAESGQSRQGFVPARWGLVALIVRSIPSFLFRRLNI
jgi:NAD(P)-dependent dehydrogenase (short-subunit alcohol dehydrogenase family)